jgi:integrase
MNTSKSETRKRTAPPDPIADWPRRHWSVFRDLSADGNTAWVAHGAVKVGCYQRLTNHGKAIGFLVNDRSPNRRRRLRSFATEQDAFDRALEIARRCESVRDLTKTDADDYAAAKVTLDEAGYGSLRFSTIAVHLVEALKKVDGNLANVVEACEQWSPEAKPQHKLAKEVVDEFMEHKRSLVLSDAYIFGLEFRLRQFAEDNGGDFYALTTKQVEQWLSAGAAQRSEALAPSTYNLIRTHLFNLFEWAVKNRYARKNCVADIETRKHKPKDVTVWTPEQATRLLNAAEEDFLAPLAISLFAGCRSEEIFRLHWEDIRNGHIVLKAGITKTAQRRTIEVQKNLAAWLNVANPRGDKAGRIWPHSRRAFSRAQYRTALNTAVAADPEGGVAAVAAIKWLRNASRHSFVSYRCAACSDRAKVATECGHTVQVLNSNYLELVLPAEAERYFNIFPPSRENIVQLPAVV